MAQTVISTLLTEYGISSDFLTAAMRDHALIHQVAMHTVSIVYPNAVDIGCMSPTLDHVGDNMKMPVLDNFLNTGLTYLHKVVEPNLNGDQSPDYHQCHIHRQDSRANLR